MPRSFAEPFARCPTTILAGFVGHFSFYQISFSFPPNVFFLQTDALFWCIPHLPNIQYILREFTEDCEDEDGEVTEEEDQTLRRVSKNLYVPIFVYKDEPKHRDLVSSCFLGLLGGTRLVHLSAIKEILTKTASVSEQANRRDDLFRSLV